MTKKEFNQQCAEYLRDCLLNGAAKIDAPDDLELLDVSIEYPLAKEQVELVLHLVHGTDIHLRIDL